MKIVLFILMWFVLIYLSFRIWMHAFAEVRLPSIPAFLYRAGAVAFTIFVGNFIWFIVGNF